MEKRLSAKRVLIVDDEENIGLALRLILEREGYRVSTARSVAEFRAMPRGADAYLLDVRLPDGSGIEILEEIRQTDARVPVVMISGQATIGEAVAATRAGAYDFLEKPLARDKVLLAIGNAIERSSLRDENDRLREELGTPRMVGESPAFLRTMEEAALAARSDARILLLGESGTGKELLAAYVHESSPFASGPFVKVNCAAIPNDLLESELCGHEKGSFTGATAARRGKFELADGGSIFLDEVGDLPLPAQAKLLRVLQEGEFHRVGGERPVRVVVRVVSATNRDLARMCADGRFREDLYYRLNVMPIRVPPLRERRGDIREMARYFLAGFCARNNFRPKQIEEDVFWALEAYSWPGNARELRNVVERMAILSPADAIGVAAIPLEMRQGDSRPRSSIHDARESAERTEIQRALDQSGGNVSQAARVLGIERTNLHKRMKALGLGREQ